MSFVAARRLSWHVARTALATQVLRRVLLRTSMVCATLLILSHSLYLPLLTLLIAHCSLPLTLRSIHLTLGSYIGLFKLLTLLCILHCTPCTLHNLHLLCILLHLTLHSLLCTLYTALRKHPAKICTSGTMYSLITCSRRSPGHRCRAQACSGPRGRPNSQRCNPTTAPKTAYPRRKRKP